uniref:acyl carrier protein n=1 Tax=Streptomyces sp. IBSBF 3136 TaxID=2903524 RepID=UPI002FDC34C6
MRDVNEEPAAGGRRALAESIEQGGGRLGVADLLARVRTATAGPGTAPAPAPDLDGLAATVAAAAGRHLPTGRLSPDADFFDAGGTSVDAVELAAELEAELGIEIDLDEVFADARPVSLARRWLPLVTDRPPTHPADGTPRGTAPAFGAHPGSEAAWLAGTASAAGAGTAPGAAGGSEATSASAAAPAPRPAPETGRPAGTASVLEATPGPDRAPAGPSGTHPSVTAAAPAAAAPIGGPAPAPG